MPAARKSRLDRSVGARAEAVQVRRDGSIGEVRHARANPRLELGEGQVIERRRGQRRQAIFPRGIGLGQLDDAAVHAGDAAHGLRSAPAELEHHVATPGLAGEDRAIELEHLDQLEEVGDRGVQVVAGVWRVGAAVAALIDDDHGVARRVKMLGHAVPEPRVGREAVDEHEGHRRPIADPHLDVQLDTRRDRDAPLDHRCRRRLRWLRHGANPSIAGEQAGLGARAATISPVSG